MGANIKMKEGIKMPRKSRMFGPKKINHIVMQLKELYLLQKAMT